jgi:hypothetical protein
MVADYEATLAPFVELFGARVSHDNVVEDEGIGRRGGMTWIGDGAFEIGAPVGPSSPVRAFVEDFGGGMHSVALQIDDAEAAKEHFARVDVRVVSEPYPGLLFTHPRDTAGVLFEWNARPQDDDPRWGAPVPPAMAAVVTVRQLAFLTVAVRNPAADADRLAEVLATDVTFDHPVDGAIEAGVSLVDGTLALVGLETGGIKRPRAHGIGFRVDDLDAAVDALEGRNCRARRLAQHLARIDPPSTPVPVFLGDELLPGDPRSDRREAPQATSAVAVPVRTSAPD